MDLIETLRSTGAVREFTEEPVSDEVVARVLDTARFAPSGGNAQAWHVVVVKSPELRRRLRDLYLPGWGDYLAMRAAGLRPWAPTNDRAAEAAALAAAPPEVLAAAGQGFAGHLDRCPVLLVVFADVAALAAVDRDADRYSFAGGASVYPFIWSILLAARAEGLGGVLTTGYVGFGCRYDAIGVTSPRDGRFSVARRTRRTRLVSPPDPPTPRDAPCRRQL